MALAGACSIAATARAQDAGGITQAMIATTTPLNDEQRDRVKAFVDAQVAILTSGDPDKVAKARNELAAVPGRPGASDVFQREYAALANPPIATLVAGKDEMRAVNALIVAQALRSADSVQLLLQRSDPATEPRLAVRTRAASALADAMAAAPLSPAQVDGAVRRIVASATAEPDWVPILHAFRALARASSIPKLPDASVTLAIGAQADLLKATVERVARDEPPSALMNAVAQALLLMRDQLMNATINADRQRLLRKQIVPSLAALAALADRHWEAAHNDDVARRMYGSAFAVADVLVSVAAKDRAQQLLTSLRKAWESDDKAAFEADLKKIAAFAAKP